MPRLPGSLILTFGLVAVGGVAGTVSLGVQRWQTQIRADQAAHELTSGDADLGKAAFKRFGCGACHAIRNVEGADGEVGPALDGVSARAFLAGEQPNDPAHMMAWIAHPQALRPGVGMPDSGLSPADTRNIAAYLYSLK